MATLDVQDIPDKLYERICSLAAEQNRSVDEQVIVLLQQQLRREKSRATHAEVLERMRRDRHEYPEGQRILDSVELLREDRDR